MMEICKVFGDSGHLRILCILTCFLVHILILFFPLLVFPSYLAVSSMLKQLAISLSLRCLSYDFVGTSLDESSEEFGTVQVSHSSLTCRKLSYSILSPGLL